MKYAVSRNEFTGCWVVINIWTATVVLSTEKLANAAWVCQNLNNMRGQ
jgi:hypothetical protein